MTNWLNYNGNIQDAAMPLIGAGNRGFRYGEGIFETMRMTDRTIPLLELHMRRFFDGLNTLRFDAGTELTPDRVAREIVELAERNDVASSARIRLVAFRGNGVLGDSANRLVNYIIETMPVERLSKDISDRGLVIDIYSSARKACDAFSHLKSNNYLPYAMAALFARDKGLDDCLVLNQYDRICESSVANIFWVKDAVLYTNPLSEGCVAGTMRQYIISTLNDIQIKEAVLEPEMLVNADEAFLSNAVAGVRWIKQFGKRSYEANLVAKIYAHLYQTITVQ